MTATTTERDNHHQKMIGAFKLADRELGTPDTSCTIAGCNCMPVSEATFDRARELITDEGFADAGVCHDCKILLPFPLGPAYAIDCAEVCEPCARERYGDKASEYLIA